MSWRQPETTKIKKNEWKKNRLINVDKNYDNEEIAIKEF